MLTRNRLDVGTVFLRLEFRVEETSHFSPHTAVLSVRPVFEEEGKVLVMQSMGGSHCTKHLACSSRVTEPLRHTVYLEVTEGQLSRYTSCSSGTQLRRVCSQHRSLSQLVTKWLYIIHHTIAYCCVGNRK